MADEMPIDSHLTLRRGVWQYVRRVPSDVQSAFPFSRVQQSLSTRDKRSAREAALQRDREWDRRFELARLKGGVASVGASIAAVDTSGWRWPDWQSLADWVEASLAEEDWQARIHMIKGGTLSPVSDPSMLPFREDEAVGEHIKRGRFLRDVTVPEYASARGPLIASLVRRVGVQLTKSSEYHDRFMAACLSAELAYLQLFQRREARLPNFSHPHPDVIEGPWRVRLTARSPLSESILESARGAGVEVAAPVLPASSTTGKSLSDCMDRWKAERRRLNKNINDNSVREMKQTVAAFQEFSGISDPGMIVRRHVLAFRSHLQDTREYKTATLNKKISFLSTLIGTALEAGWIDTGLGGSLLLEVPEGEDRREPYSDAHIARIFAHKIFMEGYRSQRVKAGGDLQYWLPLIACTHGMISSEILQIGPDTVRPHPDQPTTLCFDVTSAGSRAVKTLARRRLVPIRREILDLGLTAIIERARNRGWYWLWPAMMESKGSVARVSGYFSSFWAHLQRKELGISETDVSLYSFRHRFQDELGRYGYGEEVKKALMGHSDTGMTGRYGTKKKPRPAPIATIDEAVQTIQWPFLTKIKPSSLGGDVE